MMLKRFFFLAIPPVFLLLHVLQTPLVFPSFLLRPQVIACIDTRSDAQNLYIMLQRYGSVLLPTQETVTFLRRNEFQSAEDLEAYLGSFPQSADIDLPRALVRASTLIRPYSRIILLLDRYPSAAEIKTIGALQRRGLPPTTMRLPQTDYDPLFLAFSYTYGTQEGALDFDLLFSPRVGEYDSLELSSGGKSLAATFPEELEEGRGFQATLPIPASGDTLLELTLTGNRGSLRRSLRIQSRGEEDPQILLISDKASSRNLLETLYRVKRVTLEEVWRENLAAYPLLVFDGVALGALDSELTAAITEIYSRRSASLFFVADSPRFGKKGDNPAVERILPIELSPRSLRYLPDLGILILLDISASMMGEKLSLAKVSTLELLKNLKDTDRISILAFWDSFRFLHGFEEKRTLSSEVELAPLIAQGGTDVYKALEAGLSNLLSLDMEDRHVILISDGNTKEADFASQIERAYSRGITISTLAVGDDVNTALLSRIAQETDGRYYRVLSLEEIPSIIFEDRKSIARSSFAVDLFSIFDPASTPVGNVSGMSLFTPKTGKPIVYRNQLDDPLLIAESKDQQLTVVFLSDLYGTYTKDFFSNPEVVRGFQAVLDPVLRRHQLTVRVAEAAGRMSITVSGRDLIEPTLEVYRENRIVQHRPMEAGIYQTYHAELPATLPGSYTAVLYSQGAPLIRIPLYYNASMQGLPTDALEAWVEYRSRSFVYLPAGNLYFVLFFLSSLLVTWWARNPKWSRRSSS
ncbi:MAG: VWA domain-containing protein [Spirochaetaceae bacterium]|nr:MAG: VWA domain-containing protein [Spirochaetaceae bacterium]